MDFRAGLIASNGMEHPTRNGINVPKWKRYLNHFYREGPWCSDMPPPAKKNNGPSEARIVVFASCRGWLK